MSYNHMVRCSILVYADVVIMKTKLWLRWTDWKNQALEGRVNTFVINSISLWPARCSPEGQVLQMLMCAYTVYKLFGWLAFNFQSFTVSDRLFHRSLATLQRSYKTAPMLFCEHKRPLMIIRHHRCHSSMLMLTIKFKSWVSSHCITVAVLWNDQSKVSLVSILSQGILVPIFYKRRLAICKCPLGILLQESIRATDPWSWSCLAFSQGFPCFLKYVLWEARTWAHRQRLCWSMQLQPHVMREEQHRALLL